MKIITTVREMQQLSNTLRGQGRKIGLVPTMGALHDGHVSLMTIAKQHANVVITTIFVNPSQFGPKEDFKNYPRNLQRDQQLAESAGTDLLFVPSVEEMYASNHQTWIQVEQLTTVLEGKARPGHFKGVTTVVGMLFNITKPHIAVFGQKDAQQAIVVKQMVQDLHIDTGIILAPIVREKDGLAMSSRNAYLSKEERNDSTVLYESLQLARRNIAGGEKNCSTIISHMQSLILLKPSAKIDYISIADGSTLQEQSQLVGGTSVLISLAVRMGTTRLIDNIVLTV